MCTSIDLNVSDVACLSDSSNPLARYGTGVIHIGGLPHPRYSFDSVVGSGKVDVLVNLMQDEELKQRGDYRPLLSRHPNVLHLHFPFPDRTVPAIDYLDKILEATIPHIGKNIYVHCLGGNGRSAIVGCSLVGKLTEYTLEEIYQHLLTQHRRRAYRKYEPLNDPGQLDFLGEYLKK